MGRITKHDAFRLVFCLLLILSLAGCGNHHLKDPALDITNATLTEVLNEDSGCIVKINGVRFEDEIYYRPEGGNGEEVIEYAGDVVSYFINDSRYVFYCRAEGLDPEEWLIRVPDDGKSHLNLDEAYFVRAEDVSEIPEWLSERGAEEIFG